MRQHKLKLKMHPDKTFLGCIKKGFDFLGVHFGDTPNISNTILENHRVKLARRYAQGANVACIGDYLARWISWCAGVLKCCSGQFVSITFMGQAVSRKLAKQEFSQTPRMRKEVKQQCPMIPPSHVTGTNRRSVGVPPGARQLKIQRGEILMKQN